MTKYVSVFWLCGGECQIKIKDVCFRREVCHHAWQTMEREEVQQKHVCIAVCPFWRVRVTVFVGRLSSSCLTWVELGGCAGGGGGGGLGDLVEGRLGGGPQNVLLTSPGLISLTEVWHFLLLFWDGLLSGCCNISSQCGWGKMKGNSPGNCFFFLFPFRSC